MSKLHNDGLGKSSFMFMVYGYMIRRTAVKFRFDLTQQDVEPFSTLPFYSCFQVICLQPKKDGGILTSPSVHTGV